MNKSCKGYCFPNVIEQEKRKVCNKPGCLNKARAELLKLLDKKEKDYKKLIEIEKNLY